jgi:hypothetical protein
VIVDFASNRIVPIQFGESSEVGVGRAKPAIMLYGKCGKMRIRDKICGCIPIVKHPLQDIPVLFGWLNEADARLFNPALDAIYGFLQGERALMQPDICRDADEGRKNRPAQTHGG